jgi:hypothetical protein
VKTIKIVAENRSFCTSLLSVLETLFHLFHSKTIKIVDFLLANSRSTWKMRGLQTKNSEVFQLSFDMENVKTSTKIQKISNSRSTGTLSSRLQISFRQSTFGVFLLGMRPISRTGH